jgi:hypothetical protein
MLLTVSHSAARATNQAAALQPYGKINLMKLHKVRRDLLPSPVVKCTPLPELEGRVAEIYREQPYYRKEAAFVVHPAPLHLTPAPEPLTKSPRALHRPRASVEALSALNTFSVTNICVSFFPLCPNLALFRPRYRPGLARPYVGFSGAVDVRKPG